MPRLDEINSAATNCLSMPDLPWLQQAFQPGLVSGGIVLCAGEPGIGKSTLAMQLGGNLADQGVKVLYHATEQSLADAKERMQIIHSGPAGKLSAAITHNFFLDDSIGGIDELPHFLEQRVLHPTGAYNGAQMIIVDSIQGKGLSSTSVTKYRALYEFCVACRQKSITVFLVGHVTKNGQIAGPQTLVHNVDVVLLMKSAFRLRPCFVPKNRFGPAMLEPLVLTMDHRGRLTQSPRSTSQSCTALGYAGLGNELAEGQASVSLPQYGTRPELNAPFLPAKKIRQLLRILSTLDGVDLTSLSYEINCYLPGQQPYRGELDLAIAVSLLSSFTHQAVPAKALFVGELDLTRRIRPPGARYLTSLAHLIAQDQGERIQEVVLSAGAADRLRSTRATPNGPPVCELVKVHGADHLGQLLIGLWPDPGW